MKQFKYLLLVVLWLCQLSLASGSQIPQPLSGVVPDALRLEKLRTLKYRWVNITHDGGKTVSQEYATLVISNRLEKDGHLIFHDTITLAPNSGWEIFDRTLVYPRNDLLRPERMTLDITAQGQTVRQMSYEKGEMKVLDFDGSTNIGYPKFDNGVLSFNALLRLAPLLARKTGSVYTFPMYGEPFLFRIREPEKNEVFTITCEGQDSVRIEDKDYKCVKFTLELKSAKTRTDFWVGEEAVVKFVDTSSPGGPGSYHLEATLQPR